jgi:hypothetical protein
MLRSSSRRPGSSVKEQIGAVYASRMAAHGFAALALTPPTRERAAANRHVHRPNRPDP